MCFFKRCRSFNDVNMESLDKRASKLLAVRFGSLKKKSATLAFSAEECASVFDPDSSTSKVESFSKFDVTLQPFDLQTQNFQH